MWPRMDFLDLQQLDRVPNGWLTVVHVQGANQNAASASVISPAGQQRLANRSEVLSPTSTLHTHGGGSPEMREITV